MLSVTRANLDQICCICLLDIRPSVFTQKVYDVRKEHNMSKVLKLTAHITILKNPMNQKYISDYCRQICETCFVKIQFSYSFREKIVASTTTLKELENNLSEKDIERLQFFCRICLNRQKDLKRLDIMHLSWLKDCSGIRFTSFIDKESFRIKEGTNINEIALINDTLFPHHLCRCCLRKLKNVNEFRKSATQSFEYMVSVMGDLTFPEEQPTISKIRNFKENALEPKLRMEAFKQECEPTLETFYIKDTNQQKSSELTFDIKSVVDEADFTNEEWLENSTMGLMDSICHYSGNSDEATSEAADYSDNDYDHCLNKAPNNLSEQSKTESSDCNDNDGDHLNIDLDKMPKQRCTDPLKDELLSFGQSRKRGNLRNFTENKETIKADIPKSAALDNHKDTFFCEDCSKEFSSKCSLRKHKATVHNFDSSKMLECVICLKTFKRKSHMNAHVKAVHEKLKPFKCSYCAKTFSGKNTRKVHELSHTGDFLFVCNFCGKGFRRPYQLKVHLDIHTTIPELLCPICKRSQKSKTELENNLKMHDDKRVQCPLCGKLFSRKYHLNNHHNAVHLKLRPFKCKFCDLSYGDRRTRSKHEKSHTDYSFKCNICAIGFKTQKSLTRHIKTIGHELENI